MTGYTFQARDDAAELLIFGDIGSDWWADESVSAKQVIDQLADVRGKSLTVRINSFGGAVSDGLAIYNAIQRHGESTVVVEGVAASIASLIMMAGTTVLAYANAMIMVHAPWGITVGNAVDHRKQAETLDRFSEAMLSAYTRRVDEASARDWLSDGEDHWFTAKESLDAKLVDATIEAQPIAASAILSAFRRHRQPPLVPVSSVLPALVDDAPVETSYRARFNQLRLAALGH